MKKHTFLLLIGLWLFTASSNCFSQTAPTFEMSYFEDVESIQTFESVPQEDFTFLPTNVVNMGITESTLWVRLKLNKDSLSPKAVIVVKNTYCDNIILNYTLTNNTTILDTLGILYPHSKNKLNHYQPAFNIDIDQLSSPYVYLKIESRWSMVIDVYVEKKETFYQTRITAYLIAGLLIGGLLLMGIYNLFLFFSTRDFSYVIYVLGLLGAILSQGYIFGILIPIISPKSPEFSLRFPIVVMAFTGLCSTWFTIRFLEIKKTSMFFYKLLIFCIFFSLFSISLELLGFDSLSRKVNIVEVIGISLVIFTSAAYSLIKGNKIALYFTIAWSFYLSGMIIFALKTVDILPHNSFTRFFMLFGTFMEVLLLSFALGHKYYLVRVEKKRLEEQTREELEQLVKVQTKKLETSLEEKDVLLKEIHHRVKNNLQLVISLLDMQVASVKDIKNKEILDQSMSRVYSMSLIHQKLYQSENMAMINMKSYLEELFFYIENSYNYKNLVLESKINVDDQDLSLTQAVPLGLIVNELLTNSFKYGLHKNEANKIIISLKFESRLIVLTVADSGKGFEVEESNKGIKNSLGLFLIKSLTKQLRGTISRYVESNNFVTKLVIPVENKD